MFLKATNGGLPNLSHCDAKAEVGEHIESIGLPYAYVPAGFYMSNIPKGILQADDPSSPTSSYTLTFPIPGDTAKIPMFDPPSDMGKFVKAVLLLPREEVLGKSFNAATEYMSPNQIAEQFEEVTGRKCKVNRPSEDEYKQSLIKYAGFPEWMAQEYLENMLLFDEERFSGLYNGEKLATDVSCCLILMSGTTSGMESVMLTRSNSDNPGERETYNMEGFHKAGVQEPASELNQAPKKDRTDDAINQTIE